MVVEVVGAIAIIKTVHCRRTGQQSNLCLLESAECLFEILVDKKGFSCSFRTIFLGRITDLHQSCHCFLRIFRKLQVPGTGNEKIYGTSRPSLMCREVTVNETILDYCRITVHDKCIKVFYVSDFCSDFESLQKHLFMNTSCS